MDKNTLVFVKTANSCLGYIKDSADLAQKELQDFNLDLKPRVAQDKIKNLALRKKEILDMVKAMDGHIKTLEELVSK